MHKSHWTLSDLPGSDLFLPSRSTSDCVWAAHRSPHLDTGVGRQRNRILKSKFAKLRILLRPFFLLSLTVNILNVFVANVDNPVLWKEWVNLCGESQEKGDETEHLGWRNEDWTKTKANTGTCLSVQTPARYQDKAWASLLLDAARIITLALIQSSVVS